MILVLDHAPSYTIVHHKTKYNLTMQYLHIYIISRNEKYNRKRVLIITYIVHMASLILLFSELIGNHQWDSTAMVAPYSYPSSYNNFTLSSNAAAMESFKNQCDRLDTHISKEGVVENPMEFRVCVDFISPWFHSFYILYISSFHSFINISVICKTTHILFVSTPISVAKILTLDNEFVLSFRYCRLFFYHYLWWSDLSLWLFRWSSFWI